MSDQLSKYDRQAEDALGCARTAETGSALESAWLQCARAWQAAAASRYSAQTITEKSQLTNTPAFHK